MRFICGISESKIGHISRPTWKPCKQEFETLAELMEHIYKRHPSAWHLPRSPKGALCQMQSRR